LNSPVLIVRLILIFEMLIIYHKAFGHFLMLPPPDA